jgi:hypothetical protein
VYKELKKVVKAAEAQGFRFEPTKKGILAKSPDGIGTAATHNTPSDLNAVRQFIRDLRRIGFKPGHDLY